MQGDLEHKIIISELFYPRAVVLKLRPTELVNPARETLLIHASIWLYILCPYNCD